MTRASFPLDYLFYTSIDGSTLSGAFTAISLPEKAALPIPDDPLVREVYKDSPLKDPVDHGKTHAYTSGICSINFTQGGLHG